jgi:glycosyltransferase involved in cell wall biosynthesis
MKKILLSAYACSPHKGSEYNVGWSWATGLAKKGYDVWCVTNTEDSEACEQEKQKMKLHNLHFVPVQLPLNLDTYFLHNSLKVIYLHYWLWKKKASNLIKSLHEEHNFEIAQHVSYGSFQQGSPLYKLSDCKVIFGPVGGGQMALPIFKPFFGNSWFTEIIRKYASQFLMRYNRSLNDTLKKADVILTVNQETEALFQTSKHYRPGISFSCSDSALPTQFEKNTFQEKNDKKVLDILWVGRLIPRRGIELSLKALSYLPDDISYKLTILGDGKQGEKINSWIQKYQLDPSKINHLGWVPYTQIRKEYESADVMLFCPLRDTAGLQATEAMGFGLPVITLNISGMRTIVPDNCGIKITPTTTDGTARDMAKAIEKMYTDTAFRKQTAKNAYVEAIGNTWANKIAAVSAKYYN